MYLYSNGLLRLSHKIPIRYYYYTAELTVAFSQERSSVKKVNKAPHETSICSTSAWSNIGNNILPSMA
jgi:hypothetical protein